MQRLDALRFEQLYNRLNKRLMQYSIHYTQNHEVAEDMVHDVFRSLWQHRSRLSLDEAGYEKYLYRAIKLKVFDHFRKNSHSTAYNQTLASISLTSNGTAEEINYNDTRRAVDELISQLPERCQEVYRMSLEEGLGNKEIAKGLSISEKTVEYHLANARDFLRKRLRNIF